MIPGGIICEKSTREKSMWSHGKSWYLNIEPVDRIILRSAGRPLRVAKLGCCLKVKKVLERWGLGFSLTGKVMLSLSIYTLRGCSKIYSFFRPSLSASNTKKKWKTLQIFETLFFILKKNCHLPKFLFIKKNTEEISL